MRPVQYFTDEYLEQCKLMTPEQILQFLEEFRLLFAAQVAEQVNTQATITAQHDSKQPDE